MPPANTSSSVLYMLREIAHVRVHHRADGALLLCKHASDMGGRTSHVAKVCFPLLLVAGDVAHRSPSRLVSSLLDCAVQR